MKWFHQTRKYTEQTTDARLLPLETSSVQRPGDQPQQLPACVKLPWEQMGLSVKSRSSPQQMWQGGKKAAEGRKGSGEKISAFPSVHVRLDDHTGQKSTIQPALLSRPCLRATQLRSPICTRLLRVPLCIFLLCTCTHA